MIIASRIPRLSLTLLLLVGGALAQDPPMKVYVQWTQATPQDWIKTDCVAWPSLPKRPVPTEQGGTDETPGWPMAINIMGNVSHGYDHYALEPFTGGGCRLYVWQDDPADFSSPYGIVWEFMPPARDADIGWSYNTSWRGDVYSDSPEDERARLGFHPWAEFVPPADNLARHGVWTSDELYAAHAAVRTQHSWREWTEGLPPEDVSGGSIQREPARHTGHSVTRFLRDGVQATGVHVATDELNMQSTAGAGETIGEAVAAGACELTTAWTLNEEAGGTWESDATINFEISVGDLDMDEVGFATTTGSCAGHAACVNTGLTTDTETDTQNETLFTGAAGIKTATFTTSWSTCNTTDKFEGLLAEHCAAMHGNCQFTKIFDTDSSVTVPYPSAAADSLMVIQ